MGAWIEILTNKKIYSYCFVAPLVGAWIEIAVLLLPVATSRVAPLVGAWIEITLRTELPTPVTSRSPRGSVD